MLDHEKTVQTPVKLRLHPDSILDFNTVHKIAVCNKPGFDTFRLESGKVLVLGWEYQLLAAENELFSVEKEWVPLYDVYMRAMRALEVCQSNNSHHG